MTMGIKPGKRSSFFGRDRRGCRQRTTGTALFYAISRKDTNETVNLLERFDSLEGTLLAHNRPGGAPARPGRPVYDRAGGGALHAPGLRLLEHVAVVNGDYGSMAGSGIIKK